MIPIDQTTRQPLLTITDCAHLAGYTNPDSWRVAVARQQAPPPDGHIGRTPIWLRSTVQTWLATRQPQDPRP
jgi:predicted DNA-binding transcriptional regulator AlpA